MDLIAFSHDKNDQNTYLFIEIRCRIAGKVDNFYLKIDIHT
jgi:hypothetical protein